MKHTQLLLALSLAPLTAFAVQYSDIDVVLGDLPSSGLPVDIPIAGNTAGQLDETQFHLNSTVDDANWGGEVIFEFTLTQPAAITLTLNTQSGTDGGDVDFFLLSDLSIGPDPGGSGKMVSLSDFDFDGLDGGPPDSYRFVGLDAGTYYLLAEHFDGFDPPPSIPGSTAFTATLTVDEPTFADFEIVLGPVASAGEPLLLDTFGSAYNTELAVYDIGDDLVAENDNFGGTTQSYLAFPDGLPAGFYYAVVAGSDTTFGDGLSISTTGATGAYNLRYSQGENYLPETVTGTTNPAFPVRRVQLYCFEIVDPPSGAIDIGTLAASQEYVKLDSLGSDFDTELALYDSSGFLLARDDDKIPPDVGAGQDCDTFGVICQSEIELTDGLPAGAYYVVLAGWNHGFENGFDAEDLSDPPEMGPYTFNYTGGIVPATGDLTMPARDRQWFRFEISPSSASVIITDLTVGSGGAYSLTWESEPGASYRIDAAHELDVWVPVARGVASQGLATTYLGGGLLTGQHYFRVVKQASGGGEEG